jgi:hypothetical protein
VTVVSPTQITAIVEPAASDPTSIAAVTVGNSSSGVHPIKTQILGNQIKWTQNGTTSVISTTDGSTPPTQNAVVGQQIALTTTTYTTTAYDGPTLTPTWTVGGTRIGGYTASTASASVTELTDTDLQKNNATFYWVYPGSAIPVTYQYCVNIQGANPVLQCSLPANATFDVTGPTVSSMSTPTGSVDIFPGPVLGYGPVGIQFNPALSNDTGDSGQFEWAQLITNNVLNLTTTGGVEKTCVQVTQPVTLSGTGLDTQFPYDTGTSTHDSPSVALQSSSYTSEARTFSAQMYLLWDPALPSGCTSGSSCTSIPVPLGSVSWGWSGTASYTFGAWSLTSNNMTTPLWSAGSTFPTWSDYLPLNTPWSCH